MTRRSKSNSSKGETQVELSDGKAQSNDDVLIWSSLSYTYTISHVVSRYEPKQVGQIAHGAFDTRTYDLKPGPNRIPRDAWELAKQDPNVQKRLDLGVLSDEKEPNWRIEAQLEGYVEGNPMAKTEVFKVHSEKRHAPEKSFEQRIRQQGNRPIMDSANNAHNLGAPIVAGG